MSRYLFIYFVIHLSYVNAVCDDAATQAAVCVCLTR